jgi:MFS family permease
MFWALPEIRRGWWAVAALVNPTLVMAPIIGQLPFLWATAFLLSAIGCWRRDRRVAAVILLTVAQATHPAILMPIAFLVLAAWFPWERNKRALLAVYGIAALASLPFAYLVFDSPVMEDTSLGVKIGNFAATLAVRLFVVAAPLVLAALKHTDGGWLPHRLVRRGMEPYALGAVAVAIILNVAFLRPFELTWAWAGLARHPDPTLADYARSADFVPGATYRVLRAGDGKVGMYQLLKAGGRLDSEFFPESIGRHSFPDTATYSAFLRKRQVDTVIIFANFDNRWRTNEHALLDKLVDSDDCTSTQVGAERVEHAQRFDVYRIERTC